MSDPVILTPDGLKPLQAECHRFHNTLLAMERRLAAYVDACPERLLLHLLNKLEDGLDRVCQAFVDLGVDLGRSVPPQLHGDTELRTGVLLVWALIHELKPDPGKASSGGWCIHGGRCIVTDRFAVAVEVLDDAIAAGDKGTHFLPNPAGRRACYRRDHLWLKWQDEEMRPAKIRDRWNREYQQHGGKPIGKGKNGLWTVYQGLKKAHLEVAQVPTHS
jgi:hypothetical protein